jgi:hypothetical protein
MKLFILLTLISLVYGSGPKKNCDCDGQFDLLSASISNKFTDLETSLKTEIETGFNYQLNETINVGKLLNNSLGLIKTEIPKLEIKLYTVLSQASSQLAKNISVEINQTIVKFSELILTELNSQLIPRLTSELTSQLNSQLIPQLISELTLRFSDFEFRLKSAFRDEIGEYIDNAFNDNMDSVYDYLRPPIIAIIVLIAVNLLLTIIVIGLIIGGLVWFKLS